MIAAEVLEDLRNIERLVELDPDMKELPAGFAISNAMAAQMKQVAQYALAEGFQRLEVEGHGSSHQTYKVAAMEFATSTLFLAVDRETQQGITKPKETIPERWNWHLSQAEAFDKNVIITDELAAECKREAIKALGDDGFSLLEQNLSRFESFEAFRVGAEFFAMATLKLAEDREARDKEGCPLTIAIQ